MNNDRIHKNAVPVFNRKPIASWDAVIWGCKLVCDENLLEILNSEKAWNIPYPQKKSADVPDKHAIGANIQRFRK